MSCKACTNGFPLEYDRAPCCGRSRASMDEKDALTLLSHIITLDGRGQRKKAQYLLYLLGECNKELLVKLVTDIAYGNGKTVN